jgi:diguanylate cyclase (GGDEF)-like protein
MISLAGIEAARRIQLAKARIETNQTIALEKLDAEFRDAQRNVRDWGWWDDTYSFIQGRNPGFIVESLSNSSLLDEGAAMGVYDGNGARQALQVGPQAPTKRLDQRLADCMDSAARTRQQLGVDGIRVICPGQHKTLYVGYASDIRNSDASRSTAGTILYLNPLIENHFGHHLKRELSRIQDQLLPMPLSGKGNPSERVTPLQPKTISSDGKIIGVKPANARAEQRRELTDLALLLIGGSVIALALRIRWKLAERKQRFILRQNERWAAQRIRRSQRDLLEILDFNKLQQKQSHENPSPAHDHSSDLIFRGLLEEKGLEQTTQKGSQQSKSALDIQVIANRFERILGTARELAMHDALTGLANRRYCIEHLEREIERLKKERKFLGLLFIDLDKFKSINDTYGHRIGDDALRRTAEQLQALCRQGDFLARYGGDEFILILNPNASPASTKEAMTTCAQQAARRILESFDSIQAHTDTPYRLSLSIGITISDPLSNSSEDIIRKADLAMYQAKASQTEHIHLFTTENDSNPLSDYRLFTALQQACISDLQARNNSFSIVFQPIVDSEGQLLSVEALARWHHPELGEIPPSLFIPVAEHYRIMGRVGMNLIEATLQEYLKLIKALHINPNQLDLAINISPSQLGDADFSGHLIQKASSLGLSCNHIKIEITETAIFNSSDLVETNLRECRKAGMRISLDDFGTGFSSMSLLLMLKPDELKIDRSFVIGVLNDSYAEQIVQLLPRLTDSVSMTLVAEGVDTHESFQRLQQMGVTRFQGYLFSEALAVTELVELAGGNRLTIPLPAA